ncbi:MAG: DNA repair protein RadA [Candidatus Omnitrophota bacterium]
MAKKKTVYFCDECGFDSVQWLGKCPQCKSWNTFKEMTITAGDKGRRRIKAASRSKEFIKPLSSIKRYEQERILLDHSELDRVLGGGLYPHTTVLLAGEPGIGKSTLLLQACSTVTETYGKNVIYISAEESLEQIRERAQRLGICSDNIYIVQENNFDEFTQHIQDLQPILVVVDSIQAVFDPAVPSSPGTITQVREVAFKFSQMAKEEGFILFLIGHVTKDGVVAGPRTLEHMVDVVVYFEGDRYQSLRLIRTVKNRYGATGEIGVFEMREEGLRHIANPSSIFLPDGENITPGRVTVAVMEGRRPFLVEVQALTNKTSFNNPLRRALGVELNKVSLLLAVIERSLTLNFAGYDVFIKAVGGLKLQEAACDLSLCLAIISSFTMVTISPQIVVIGEVGLGGEIRKVQRLESRIKEAARLGFKQVVVPKKNLKEKLTQDISVREVGTLADAYDLFFEPASRKS